MNRGDQDHLADILCDYRERLERARNDLDPRLDETGFPLDPIAGEMLRVEARMLDVENFMRSDREAQELVERRERRRPRNRVRELLRPRLGLLYHHRPALLVVPSSYYTIDPPSPAPTISIVTPSFNQGRFIERTLYSVIGQNYPALEYVVQDGGSSDETVEVLRRYEGSLHHWVSEPDAGQADAINRGFAHTSGEIMAYLNSDDLLMPGSLAAVARYFSKHPDVDALYSHRIIVNEDDQRVGSWLLPRHDSDELALVDFVPQETLFWRRSAWEAAGGQLDAGMNFAIDWDLLLRMRDSGAKMVRLPRFLGAFRVHDSQKTQTLGDLGRNETDALRRRVHGRGMSLEEAFLRVRPYMRRHVPYHLWHGLRARLPGHRTAVRLLPDEPWLRAPAEGEAVERPSTEAQADTTPSGPAPPSSGDQRPSRSQSPNSASTPTAR